MITHIRVKNFKSWKDSEEGGTHSIDGLFSGQIVQERAVYCRCCCCLSRLLGHNETSFLSVMQIRL